MCDCSLGGQGIIFQGRHGLTCDSKTVPVQNSDEYHMAVPVQDSDKYHIQVIHIAALHRDSDCY